MMSLIELLADNHGDFLNHRSGWRHEQLPQKQTPVVFHLKSASKNQAGAAKIRSLWALIGPSAGV